MIKEIILLCLTAVLCLVQTETYSQSLTGRKVSVKFCFTYDDYRNGNWQCAYNVQIKTKNKKASLSSGEIEYLFQSDSRHLNKVLRHDVLLVEANGHLFINQRHLYHYISHFANNYTSCFAVDTALVFVGHLRFGDRGNEYVDYQSGTGLPYDYQGVTMLGHRYLASKPYNSITLYPNYFEINDNGVYCFMVNSNSINTTKLNESLEDILNGKTPTCALNEEEEVWLSSLLESHKNKLKPASPYRQW